MDQNQNDNPNPQSNEPTRIGGAQVYQSPDPVYAPPSTPMYNAPGAPPPAKSNTTKWVLIGVGGALLLCCCCLIVAGLTMWPAIMEIWNSM